MKNLMKMIIRWLVTSKIISVPRLYIEGIIAYAIARKKIPKEVFDLIDKVKKDPGILIREFGIYNIYMIVKKTEKIPGDIAEVGVYKGGSAKIICKTTQKSVHLFDTFEGLPDLGDNDDLKQFHKGDFLAQFEQVKNSFKEYPNAHFYKGIFPFTAKSIEDKKFSFVHLDVDIYQSTLDALKFFYHRMSRGGVIISHDYPGSVGVKKAFDEFFKDKPEIVIEVTPLSDQCLVVKV